MIQGLGRFVFGVCLPLASLLVAVSVFAQSQQGLAARQFGIGQPATIDDIPPGQLKRRLEILPPHASQRALEWLQDIEFTGTDLDVLRVDDEGGIHIADTLLPELSGDTATADASGATSMPANILDDVFLLHSRPGAPHRVFLDFDGHLISGTAWNSGGVETLYAQAFDLDGNPADFNDIERAHIAEVWHRVAEDFAVFDIDVTTEEPVSFDRYSGRVVITQSRDAMGTSMPYANAGGVAYINVFGGHNYHTYYSPALVYYNNLGSTSSYVAEASSHEFGHNLGLSHDGTLSGATYYSGHGSGLISWAPIMGNSYYNNVTQFSRGEYPDANQQQDDIAIITRKLDVVPDDHGDDVHSGTALMVTGEGSIVSSNPELDPHGSLPENKGIIGHPWDVDVFTFTSGSGAVTLTVTPAWDAFYPGTSRRGANLDIEARLADAAGNLVAAADSADDTAATLSVNVAAGNYQLLVSAVGSDLAPYSAYASQGQYFINGSVRPVTLDTTAPNPDPMGFAIPPAGTGEHSITMTAMAAVDETSAVQYRFNCLSGGTGCTGSGWQEHTTYTATGLAAGTLYTFSVSARDVTGNQTASSPPASATTDAPSNLTAETSFESTSESPVAGIVDGTRAALLSDDGFPQSITEIESSGKPDLRHTYLEHRWSFTVGGGSSATVFANAWSGSSTDGDAFGFEYSLDGGNQWHSLFTVDETAVDNAESAALPASTQGVVWIRVIDTNRTSGNRERNTVHVDRLAVLVADASSQPPSTALTLVARGYKIQGTHQVDLEWSGADRVDVFRDDTLIAAGVTGNSYADAIGSKGSGSYMHRVCAAETADQCSDNVTTTL